MVPEGPTRAGGAATPWPRHLGLWGPRALSRLRFPLVCLSCTVKIPIKSLGRSDLCIASFPPVFISSCFSARISRSRLPCLPPPPTMFKMSMLGCLREEIEEGVTGGRCYRRGIMELRGSSGTGV